MPEPSNTIHDEKNSSIETENQQQEEIPIIGIGASAGGINSIKSFFKSMPSDSGCAFVIIMHLDPHRESYLSEIISGNTTMITQQATNKVDVKPNQVFVIPPSSQIEVSDTEISVITVSDRDELKLPIDHFFRSLSEKKKDKAIGILFSGTGTDGTLGLRHIKGEGGLVIVESLESAEYKGMPYNAIKNVEVDYILKPGEIPEQLLTYLDINTNLSKIKEKEDHIRQKVKTILNIIYANIKYDFSSYKFNTIYRRIKRRMSILQIDNIEKYINILRNDSEEIPKLFNEFLIGVTSFFRDKDVFDYVEKKLIPALFQSKEKDLILRVWVPACSTGEEAYSLAILFYEYMKSHSIKGKVQIFATDIDELAIEKARSGKFPKNIEVDIPKRFLSNHFTLNEDYYIIKKHIRDMIVFAIQNPLSDPPFSNMNLISCRNFLIYLESDMQEKLLKLFHYSLQPGGFLLLGNSETIGKARSIFKVIDQKLRIFSKKEFLGLADDSQYLYPPLTHAPFKKEDSKQDKMIGEREPLARIMKNYIIDLYTPAGVIINKNQRVLFIHGNCDDFLRVSSGTISHDILDMARDDLRVYLATAIRKVLTGEEKVQIEGLKMNRDGKSISFNLVVQEIDNNISKDLYLIIFEKVKAEEKEAISQKDLNEIDFESERIDQLEKELKLTKEDLQTTVEELETSNEELKSTNEELQSSNEELKSSNEELQTSQEELQSVNEELLTVNNELESKMQELSETNDDLSNLITNTQIATLFVANDLTIRRFTPGITNLLNIIKHDVGRAMSHISTNLNYDNLENDVKEVIDTLIPLEKEIQNNDGDWFNMVIRPYRTIENVIEGAVITFFDITKQKLQEQKYRKAFNQADFYKNILIHDIRNIFQVIINSVELSREILKLPDQIDSMDDIFDNLDLAIKKGIHLIETIEMNLKVDDLLTVHKSVDALEMLKNSISYVETKYENEDIVINIDNKTEETKVEVLACDLLKNVFDNILINAVLYNNNPVKKIDVSITREDMKGTSYFKLEFADNGRGIKPEDKPLIFSLEKNLSSKGMGIGLKLVKTLVKSYEGEIMVENRVSGDYQKGSVFIILLQEAKQ